jgi:hypothetical protein
MPRPPAISSFVVEMCCCSVPLVAQASEAACDLGTLVRCGAVACVVLYHASRWTLDLLTGPMDHAPSFLAADFVSEAYRNHTHLSGG